MLPWPLEQPLRLKNMQMYRVQLSGIEFRDFNSEKVIFLKKNAIKSQKVGELSNDVSLLSEYLAQFFVVAIARIFTFKGGARLARIERLAWTALIRGKTTGHFEARHKLAHN